MAIQSLTIHSDQHGHRIILESTITIAVNTSCDGLIIKSGHPSGPVLSYYGLLAVIQESDASELEKLGVKRE